MRLRSKVWDRFRSGSGVSGADRGSAASFGEVPERLERVPERGASFGEEVLESSGARLWTGPAEHRATSLESPAREPDPEPEDKLQDRAKPHVPNFGPRASGLEPRASGLDLRVASLGSEVLDVGLRNELQDRAQELRTGSFGLRTFGAELRAPSVRPKLWISGLGVGLGGSDRKPPTLTFTLGAPRFGPRT